MASLAEYEAAVAASSPRAWWKLDDVSGNPVDSSGNSLNMTSSSITTYQEPGPFTGWDAIECVNSSGGSRAAVSTQVDNVTFECFLRVDAVGAANQFVFANQATNNGWAVLLSTDLKIQALVQGVAFQSKSPNALVAGEWYHIVVTRRSTVWKYFVNGLPDTTSAGTSTPNASPTVTSLFGSASFSGAMAQAAYYDTALSDATILAHYEAAAGPYGDLSKATWRVGTITVPSGASTVSVTGLKGNDGLGPKAVLFYGTNWLTEDTVVATSGLGMFRGMAGPRYSDAALIQNAAFITPPGNAHAIDNYGILALDTSGVGTNILYRATVSITSDGFNAAFDTGVSGGYKVVYVALMDAVDVGSFVGTTTQANLAFGFKAGASLHHGAWAGPSVTGNDRTQEWYGGGSYPGVSGWEAAWLDALCFPTSSSGQTYNEIAANQNPTVISATGMKFTGPFLTPSNLFMHPTGAGLTGMRFQGEAEDGGMIVAWDDPASTTGANTPASSNGGTVTVTGFSFEPGLLLGYTLGDLSSGGSTGGFGGAGFFVVTPDFQWAAILCGSVAPGAFQSFQRGFADHVKGSLSQIHAGTVELTTDGFVMTTVEDSVGASQTVWQAFGHPLKASWIPKLYRIGPR